MKMPKAKSQEPRVKKMPPKDTEEYKVRRDRNNLAVKKSREKAREKKLESNQRVQKLREENQALEQKVTILSKELSVLKDLFLTHAQGLQIPSNETKEEDITDLVKVKKETDSDTEADNTFTVNTEAILKDHEYSSPSKLHKN
ncbi:unnamed protein product [Owenia fusiformis]|uniref:BZIP domain-containing protein n=1 Tax=Owenia fusiformis TaxID=6347 RepID=A0A8S4NEI7_OWEFU|nr:unnamed protein product [Owenia fusiformis]